MKGTRRWNGVHNEMSRGLQVAMRDERHIEARSAANPNRDAGYSQRSANRRLIAADALQACGCPERLAVLEISHQRL